MGYPRNVCHWIADTEVPSAGGSYFPKVNPATEDTLALVARGSSAEVNLAIEAGERAFWGWSETPVAERAAPLRRAALLLRASAAEFAECIARESGKSEKIARTEVEGAVRCGLFMADQVGRFSPEHLPSAVPGRVLKLIRQSIGVGALLTPYNNPLAGVAAKTFPALLCGNSVVLKAHEDTPATPLLFGQVLKEAGVPSGVYSVVEGTGGEVGVPLVSDSRIRFVSFTGSLAVGQTILKATADRLAKVSIETGGKNPFVVCDDADIERAVDAAVAGSFVDAGQRCAATSRIILFETIYDAFKTRFVARARRLSVGVHEGDEYGAIINEKRMNNILSAVRDAERRGATVLTGGHRVGEKGFFIAPTIVEHLSPDDPLSEQELFGPIVALYPAKNLEEAIGLADHGKYRLSSAIHTSDPLKAAAFIEKHLTGVVRVNGPTHGSEPHVPFGGIGLSGNGWREPGAKALDFYSDLKQVSFDA